MPPPLPSSHRGMTKNPLKPSRYRPGKAIPEEPSSEEEEEEEDEEAQKEEERRKRIEAQRRRQQAPKASSFPAAAVAQQEEDDEDEEGFVTDEEDGKPAPAPKAAQSTDDLTPGSKTAPAPTTAESDEEEGEEEEEEEEEESSEEESSSEDEAPRRMLIRPTFIKKDKRNQESAGQTKAQSQAEAEAEEAKRAAQRQEKADMHIRDQLEKAAIARSSANRAWDDDELIEADDEEAIDDKDNLDPEAELAAWKLRELKRVKRERLAIEESEKEREEIERRRNLTAEERDREDSEFIAKQKEDRDANRGQTGFMQRYFHKGAFFRGDLEAEGLDRRELMGARFEDDVNRDTLPQYMQVRDMTKLGKKGRTRYRDLKSEDTGRFGDGLENRRRRDGPPEGVTDERFMPDHHDDRDRGPTGANASAVKTRRFSRSRSPRRDRRDDRDRSASRERRKRSPSPYEDREKRRRVD
jgi:microfibrillar-associated protein 1